MIDNIKENAPSGATHYQVMEMISRIFYFKKVNGEIFWFNDCDFWSSIRKDDGLIHEKKMRKLIKPLKGLF